MNSRIFPGRILKNQIRIFITLVLMCVFKVPLLAQGIIIDHSSTDITQIPEDYIYKAKDSLHIGYGHTSHGSQLTTGMTGLIAFANNGGLGLSLPNNIFQWNNGGANGALDLEEGSGYDAGWLELDCGNYPNWVNETREYLNDASNSDVNVIMWSWCGQASGRAEQEMIDKYLDPMAQLEGEYPGVKFVYMTGHADGSGDEGNLHIRNQQIRDFCVENDKILYDFYDIECYDPDGNYYGDQWVDDACNYYGGNWAEEWQNSHSEGVDWYECESAHSQPLNANRKAYAAWWLWARLAGWNPVSSNEEKIQTGFQFINFPNPFTDKTTIQFQLLKSSFISIDIFSLQGQHIFSLVNKEYPPGVHKVSFNAGNLPVGIYNCSLKAGENIGFIQLCKRK